MDQSSIQLQVELLGSVRRAFSTRRPVLTHLNADTTWLLQLPYPQIPASGRTHYNILIDPWLRGPQSDVASWFSKQWHVVESSVQNIAELEERLQEVHRLTHDLRENKRRSNKLSTQGPPDRSFVDVVVVSHEFTDHCHRDTLQQVDKSVPVFATTVSLIRLGSPSRIADGVRKQQTSFENGIISCWLRISRCFPAKRPIGGLPLSGPYRNGWASPELSKIAIRYICTLVCF